MEGRSRAAVDDTTSGDSGDSADSGDSGDEFLTPNSAADVYQKIDFGPPGGPSRRVWPQRSPKDGPRMSKIKIYQNIYKIYQNISEIIINIDKNHKIYIYFSKKSKFFRHLKHIRMVPHLGLRKSQNSSGTLNTLEWSLTWDSKSTNYTK